MKHVFISYVRENDCIVRQLVDQLTVSGVKVWFDRNDIAPGVRWQQAVRRAVNEGAYFIACFSKEYNQRSITYMNEELTLAIDVLRQRPTDISWFMPVKLTECEIPDRDIGAGETLRSIQWIDLHQDWNSGIKRILDVIKPTPPDLQNLLAVIKTGNESVKLTAVLALAQYRENGIPFLTDLLDNPEAAGAAVEALKRIGTVAVPGLLKAANQHKSELVRVNAVITLGDIPAPGIGAALVTGLRDPSDKVRAIIGAVLGRIADDEVIQLLVKALNDEDEGVGENAMFALSKVGERAVPALVENLNTKYHLRAITALRLIGEPSVLPLIHALHDSSRRFDAAMALGMIGDNRAVSALVPMLADDNFLARHVAGLALKNIGTAEAIDAIEQGKA